MSKGVIDVAVVLIVAFITAMAAWQGPGGQRDEQRQQHKELMKCLGDQKPENCKARPITGPNDVMGEQK